MLSGFFGSLVSLVISSFNPYQSSSDQSTHYSFTLSLRDENVPLPQAHLRTIYFALYKCTHYKVFFTTVCWCLHGLFFYRTDLLCSSVYF